VAKGTSAKVRPFGTTSSYSSPEIPRKRLATEDSENEGASASRTHAAIIVSKQGRFASRPAVESTFISNFRLWPTRSMFCSFMSLEREERARSFGMHFASGLFKGTYQAESASKAREKPTSPALCTSRESVSVSKAQTDRAMASSIILSSLSIDSTGSYFTCIGLPIDNPEILSRGAMEEACWIAPGDPAKREIAEFVEGATRT